MRPAEAAFMQGALRSYVDGDVWVCVFCEARNPLAETHCGHCGLSLAGGTIAPVAEQHRPTFIKTTAHPVAELSIALGLLLLWKLGDIAAGSKTAGAIARGRAIWRAERSLQLPSEARLQRLVLPHDLVVRGLDTYYATAHLGGMALLAGWLLWRHRAGYARWRNAVVVTTALCFVLQLVTVAPPRLVPGLGVVDTATRDGESVYGHAHFANQLSSMPSVHLAWAILVATAVCVVGTTRKRWLALLHPVTTLAAIVLTGNHYWLDAVAAAAVTAVVLRLSSERGSPADSAVPVGEGPGRT